MPAISKLRDINRGELIRALSRLGVSVSKRGGKGDHYKVTFKNQKSMPIDNFKCKIQLKYIVDEIEALSCNITWEDIEKEL